jgi:hypothetical protein
MSFSFNVKSNTRTELKARARKALADCIVEQRAHDTDADHLFRTVANQIDMLPVQVGHGDTPDLYCKAHGSVWSESGFVRSCSLNVEVGIAEQPTA